ncbi:anti-sigma factor antagonist [Streptomyces sp. NPDC018026]|uniref:anti-sigma factor antagonist n=1 Tax=Streptomyces sp. NPDC018026 TaxID=3365031 RepID=UPI00379CEB78
MAEIEGAAVPERLLITRTTTGDGVGLVILAGEVDLDGSSRLRDVLLSSVRSAPGTVVDRLAAPRDAVERVLRLVGVDALIPCYPSVEQALTA